MAQPSRYELEACDKEIQQLQQRILDSVHAAQEPTLAIEAKKAHVHSPRLHLEQRRLLKGHFGKIYAMHWSQSNPHLLTSAAQDGNLLVWDAHSAIRKQSIPLDSPWVMSCALSPNTTLVACGGLNNLISVFRTNNGLSLDQIENGTRIAPTQSLSGHDGYISCSRWLTDNQILSSSGDGTCILWDVAQQKPISRFRGHCGDVMSLSIANDGKTFVSGSIDRTSKLWDTRLSPGSEKAAKSLGTFYGHELDVNTVQFLPDSQSFVSGSDDSSIRLFDLRARAQLQKFSKSSSAITSVCSSGSGRYLFSGHDSNAVHSWCTLSGAELQTLDFNDRVSCIGMNADGRALGCASWDSTVQVYG